MLCETCKQREARVFLTHIVGDEVRKHQFCETCARQQDLNQYRESSSEIVEEPGWLSLFGPGIFDEMVNGMGNRDPHYAKDAFTFVLEAFECIRLQRSLEENVMVTNVSGQAFLEMLRAFALGRFGANAKAVLNGWGVFKCEDFGEIVFNLVDAKVLFAQPEESKDDFQGGYDFEAAFPGPEA